MLEKYLPVMNPKWPAAERRPGGRRGVLPGGRPGDTPVLLDEGLLLFYALTLHGEMSAEELNWLFECLPNEGDA